MKLKDIPILKIALLGGAGYVIYKFWKGDWKLPSLIPVLPDFPDITIFGHDYPTIKEASTETIVHFIESTKEAVETEPDIMKYDPFGIWDEFLRQSWKELEERGTSAIPEFPTDIYDVKLRLEQIAAGYSSKDVETAPTEILEQVEDIPILDPFGISEVFQEKAEEEIVRRKKRTAVTTAAEQVVQASSVAERLSSMKALIQQNIAASGG